MFKVYYSDSYYLAIAGPYSLNPADLSTGNEATIIDWNKDFDKDQVDEDFENYLSSLNKDD